MHVTLYIQCVHGRHAPIMTVSWWLSIPNFLYPRTIFTSKYRTGIQSTLVNILYRVIPRCSTKGNSVSCDGGTPAHPVPVKCLEDEVATAFPSLTLERGRKVRRRSTVHVFYKCHTQEGGNMAECSDCGEWFHEECVSFPPSVWTNPKYKWLCDSSKHQS